MTCTEKDNREVNLGAKLTECADSVWRTHHQCKKHSCTQKLNSTQLLSIDKTRRSAPTRNVQMRSTKPARLRISPASGCGRSVKIKYLKLWRFIHFRNCIGLVLGCIEADVCKWILNTRWKALDEIYQIYMRLLGEKYQHWKWDNENIHWICT